MLIIGQGTAYYILLMFRILEGLTLFLVTKICIILVPRYTR